MKVSPEKTIKHSFILTEKDVEKLLHKRYLHTWLRWQDSNGQSRLSTVLEIPNSLGSAKMKFVMHAATLQEQHWDHLMHAGLELPDDAVLESLSHNQLSAQVFGKLKTPLTILRLIAILQAQGLSNESITTRFIPRNFEQLGDPDIKNKIFSAINDIIDRQQRIALCNEILENKLNPYSHILRMSESWFFDSAASKARILAILQEARNTPPPPLASAPPASPPKPARKATVSTPVSLGAPPAAKPPLTREEIEKRKKELQQAEVALQNTEIAELSDKVDGYLEMSNNLGVIWSAPKKPTPNSTQSLDVDFEVDAERSAPAPAPQRFLSQRPAQPRKPEPAPAKKSPSSSEDEEDYTSENETPKESTGFWNTLFS